VSVNLVTCGTANFCHCCFLSLFLSFAHLISDRKWDCCILSLGSFPPCHWRRYHSQFSIVALLRRRSEIIFSILHSTMQVRHLPVKSFNFRFLHLAATRSFFSTSPFQCFHSFIYVGVVVCLILAAIVTGIVLGMTGLKPGVVFWLNIFLCFVCADSMTMLISYISPDLISAICISR
jgi:hypothetical protein